MGFFSDLLKNKYVNRFIQPQVNVAQKVIPRVKDVFRQSAPTYQNFQNQVVQPIQRKIVQPINNNYYQPARQQYPTLAKMSDFSTKLQNAPRKFVVDYLRQQVRNPVSLISRQTFTPTTKAEKFLLGNEPVIPAEKSWAAQKTGSPAAGVALTLAGSVLDLTGAGGGKKEIAKYLTKVDDVAKIKGLTKGLNLSDEVVGKVAKSKNVKEIEGLLKPTGSEGLKVTNKTINADDKLVMNEYINRSRLGYNIDNTLADEIDTIVKGGKNTKISTLSKEKVGIKPEAIKSVLPEKSQIVQKLSSFVSSKPQNGINVNRLNISNTAKNRIVKEINNIKPQIEAKVGAKLTNQEAVTLADNSSKTLNSAAGREQTKQWEAALLKTRQQLAASAKSNTIDKAFIENLKNVKALATDTARKLQSFSIDADPLSATPKQAILESILKVNDNTDEILKAAKGVNFDDAKQATNFYRTFVKPKTSEWVDLIRYNSMLSSPLTHIKNITTNALQSIIVKPVEKTLTGVVDIFSKKPTNFAGEGVAYTVGLHKSWGAATQKFADVMSGKAGFTNLDLKYIPPSTGAGTKFLSFPTKMLDGMDQFFTTLASGGEKAALNLKIKKGIKIGNIDEIAKEKAAYTVFREKLGNSEQGYLLDGIDKVTGIVEKARQSDNPLISTVAKFTLPFVRTPMNIFKQGIEYSPLGVATTIGAKNIPEQISKALIGSAVFGGAATLVGSGRLTWGEPINEKQKNEFRAAGMQPYAIKIGDKWVAYKYLGPLAFPLAMTAAIDYEMKNGRMDDTTSERILGMVARYGTFLADQSYAKSMGDLLKAVGGDESGIARVISNYPQQLIPLRALFGWIARITDPNQRKISKDANFIEKQTQMLMQNIPGLSQKLETRPDAFGNPIPNQNRVFNAFSPLSVTTENPVGKDVWQSSENKRAESRQIADLKKGQGGKTDSGKYVVKVGDEYKTFNEQQYKKYNFEKDNGDENTTYSKYSLEADRLKDSGDINGWMDKTKAYLSYYSEYIKTLDPNSSEYYTAVKRYENLLDTADKYKGYAGFYKPKKGRVGGSGSKAKKTAAINALKNFRAKEIAAPKMPTTSKISGGKSIAQISSELARGR